MTELCDHNVITRGELDGKVIWTCTECADQFVPVEEEDDG